MNGKIYFEYIKLKILINYKKKLKLLNEIEK
jgi:hypothetical protein